MPALTRFAIAALALAAALPAAPALADTLCDNGNIYAVHNRPAAGSTLCRFARPVRIESIMTYHWNNGRGAPGGTITVRSRTTGRVYGPFWVETTPNEGRVRSVYWTAAPGLTLPAGDYDIVDSDQATWSWNAASGNSGIVVIKGVFVAPAAATASVTARPVAAPVTVAKPPVVTSRKPRVGGMHQKRIPARRMFR